MLKYINSLLLLPCTECKHYHMQFLSAVIYNALHCVCAILLLHGNRMKCASEKTTEMAGIIIFGILYWNSEVENGFSPRTHTRTSISRFYVYSLFLASTLNIKQFRLQFHFRAADSYCQQYPYTWKRFQFLLWFKVTKNRRNNIRISTLSLFKSLVLIPHDIRNGK